MEQEKRSAKDLIGKLVGATVRPALNVDIVALVVRFDRETKFVFYHEGIKPKEILIELNLLIKAGGEPIGLVGCSESGVKDLWTYYTKPLEEYTDESWVKDYLHELMDVFQNLFESKLGEILGGPELKKGG